MAWVLVLRASPGAAQNPADCRAAALDLEVADVTETSSNPCLDLVVFLYTANRDVQEEIDRILAPTMPNPSEALGQRALQQANPGHAALSGTFAQSEAVPSVVPAGVASGSIAMVGSDAGSDALAAIGLNPALLFFAREASEEIAKYSRLLDLTMFLPVSSVAPDVADPGGDDAIDYFGVRLRLNWLGASAGADLWAAADSLLDAHLLSAQAVVGEIRELLAAAPDLRACASELSAATTDEAVAAACGAPLDLDVDLEQAAVLGRELAGIRRTLDSDYFGADVRFDEGDPTLGAVPGASGSFLFAGIAYGRRFAVGIDSGTDVGIRLRLGARHASLDVGGASALSAEGGAGVELSRSLADQQVSLSAAVEFRVGDDDLATDEQLQTDFAIARASLVVPVLAANTVSLSVGVPIAGADVSPYMSVNFNWSLLLPDRPTFP